MLIAAIPPIPIPEAEVERRRARYQAFASPGTTVRVRPLRGGPPLTDTEAELSEAAGFMLSEAAAAAAEGADGILVDCTADDIAARIAALTGLPTVGALAAGARLALSLGMRVSLLALDDAWAAMLRPRLEAYAPGRIASVESVGAHVYTLRAPEDPEAERRRFFSLLEAAGRSATVSGADVVILGSTTVTDGLEALRSLLGVPVVAPGIAALAELEAAIDAGRPFV